MRILVFLLVSLGFLSCSTSDRKAIPAAVGMPGDVYLIMDSAQWKGPLGDLVDSVFEAEMVGLPRKESIYRLHWIDPRKFSTILRQRRNLIFVMTLDQQRAGGSTVRSYFTPESIQRIKDQPEEFYRSAHDVFARGQEVMYLFGKTEANLSKQLRAYAPRLVDIFNDRERERLTHSLFKAGQQKGLTQILNKELKCQLQIPFGYKLAEKSEDFVWLRQINPRDDKDIFIARKKYESQNDFKLQNLIRFRDEVCRKHLFEDPDQSDTYLITETEVPFIKVTSDTLNFNGHFAMDLRGLWRSNTLGMGGPFYGIALVDQATQHFYYVEGFTYSPGRDQREIMRELEAIIYTFGTSSDIRAN